MRATVTCFGSTASCSVLSAVMSKIFGRSGKAVVLVLGFMVAAGLVVGLNWPHSKTVGYVSPQSFDILKVLPPPPVEGSAAAEQDAAIFRTTRSLQGTPRWRLATHDIAISPADLAADFSCALGFTVSDEFAPKRFSSSCVPRTWPTRHRAPPSSFTNENDRSSCSQVPLVSQSTKCRTATTIHRATPRAAGSGPNCLHNLRQTGPSRSKPAVAPMVRAASFAAYTAGALLKLVV